MALKVKVKLYFKPSSIVTTVYCSGKSAKLFWVGGFTFEHPSPPPTNNQQHIGGLVMTSKATGNPFLRCWSIGKIWQNVCLCYVIVNTYSGNNPISWLAIIVTLALMFKHQKHKERISSFPNVMNVVSQYKAIEGLFRWSSSLIRQDQCTNHISLVHRPLSTHMLIGILKEAHSGLIRNSRS